MCRGFFIAPCQLRYNRSMDTLTRQAVSATLHCLTGCAIGEILGLVIATALGWHNLASIMLAVGLAFVFGYSLALWPLRRAGLPWARALKIAIAADTLSIATMELVDNAFMMAVPGALDAGLNNLLFWGSLVLALAIAFVVTVPVNRWLMSRGLGHALAHEYHKDHHEEHHHG